MKLTLDNYTNVLKQFNMFNGSQIGLIGAILCDAATYSSNGAFPDELEIHIIDKHTQYSAERVDPCPDFYGMFLIKWASQDDTINDELTLYDLDNNMCTLCQAFEQTKNLHKI